ncbi:MAG: Primosomal protein N' [Candidatus Anoxychlamydiales bacterium]|nr:Primosomal protein N' [Candidatus Anoxychlamydiales bacterium]
MNDNKYASVILETNIDKPLDYKIPDTLINKLYVGNLVEVPIRGIFKKAYIYELKNKTSINKTFFIKRLVIKEPISKELLKLSIWMSKYYICSLSKILKLIIPTSIRKEIDIKTKLFISSNKSKNELLKIISSSIKKSPTQVKVLSEFLKIKKGIFLSDLLKITNTSKSPVDTLIKKNILKSKKLDLDHDNFLFNQSFFYTKEKKLTENQKEAFDKINNSLEKNIFQTHLIFGITGSGKTEIYLQAIKKALILKKSIIMLVPEVALTEQTILRFKERFTEKIAIIHHKKSMGEKSKAFLEMQEGKINIVIGARSAVFAPLKNLGLIIVDEEHDTSYKQIDEMPTYNAKHIAIKRAQIENATVILGSATPSIESYYNALNNKYILSHLDSRIGVAKLPKINTVDMKNEIIKKTSYIYFSQTLLDAIKKRYEKGEQTLLFLNRRGFHTNLYCTSCAFVFRCKHCDVSLTYHKTSDQLSCHLCNAHIKKPKICPNCKGKDYIKFKGFGTEHVESYLKYIFPFMKVLRLDRDTTSSKSSFEDILKKFRSSKADVLIGTQMIVKGHHFPAVTLVGVLNTDSALNIADFRSSEYVFSLLTQVSGRSGREDLLGEVIIQTNMPFNPTIQLSLKQDYVAFYKKEVEQRKLFDYPPFTQMAKIVFSSLDENSAKIKSEEFRKKLIENLSKDFIIHPSMPTYKTKVKDLYSYQIIIRFKNLNLLINTINEIKKSFKILKKTSMLIDIDPIFT